MTQLVLRSTERERIHSNALSVVMCTDVSGSAHRPRRYTDRETNARANVRAIVRMFARTFVFAVSIETVNTTPGADDFAPGFMYLPVRLIVTAFSPPI